MGITGIWQWVIVLVLVLLLFGAGKIPRLMGDVAKGVKAFKKGMREDEEAEEQVTDQSGEAKEIPAEQKADKEAKS